MPVPAWLQSLSQNPAPSSTALADFTQQYNTDIQSLGTGGGVNQPVNPVDLLLGGAQTPAGAVTAGGPAVDTSVSQRQMSQEEARRQLMSGSANDPKTWAAYKLIYGRPHNSSPEGRALTEQGGSPAAQQQAGQQTYSGFQTPGGQNFYPGRESVDRAAGIEGGPSLQEMVDLPSATQPMGFGAQTITQDAAGQPFSDNQYAGAASAQWLAKQLGGEYIAAEDYEGGLAGTMPGAAYIKMPDGTMMNAGLVGQKFQRVQAEYQMQLKNYERNLAQNPNIVGTGFLSKPGNPIEMLKNRLAGTPYSNTNEAGGNQGIQSAIGAGQNAFGQPLGAGGPNADFTNAPVSAQNPIDQSTQPGTQATVPPAGSPFAPQGPQPGAGPGGTQDPGYPNWTGQQGGFTNPSFDMPGGGGELTFGNPSFNMPGGGAQQPGGGGFGAIDPGLFGGGPGTGWQGGGGAPGAGGQGPSYNQPQQAFNPQTFDYNMPSAGNPWDSLGQGGGGMASLGSLLTGVDQLRQKGYGLGGGWNPMTGFGGAIGTPGPQQGGMMSVIPERPPMQPQGAMNQNYYGLM